MVRIYKTFRFNNRLKTVRNKLYIWKQQNLTLTGIVLIITNFGISQLLYCDSEIHIPEWLSNKQMTFCMTFYSDIIMYWSEIKLTGVNSYQKVMNQYIFGTSF